jgi:hypothetical protein
LVCTLFLHHLDDAAAVDETVVDRVALAEHERRHDIVLQVLCADNDELGRIIARTRGLDGVTEVEPMLELEVHKFTYAGAGAQL